MNPDPLGNFIAATEPPAERLDAVMSALRARGVLPGPERALLGAVCAARTPNLARARRLPGLRWYGLAPAALAVAAIVLVLWQRNTPSTPDMTPLSVELSQSPSVVELQPTPEVEIAHQGFGRLEGTRLEPTLRWEGGRVRVSVEPGRDLRFSALTREAKIEVTGTIFSLDRDALGTRVTVERGEVLVTCEADTEGPRPLRAGQERLCDPVSAAALLGRLRRLQDTGASPEQLIVGIEAALRIAEPSSPVSLELEALRVLALRDLGRKAEAQQAARDYLARPDAPRAEQIRRVLAEYEP